MTVTFRQTGCACHFYSEDNTPPLNVLGHWEGCYSHGDGTRGNCDTPTTKLETRLGRRVRADLGSVLGAGGSPAAEGQAASPHIPCLCRQPGPSTQHPGQSSSAFRGGDSSKHVPLQGCWLHGDMYMLVLLWKLCPPPQPVPSVSPLGTGNSQRKERVNRRALASIRASRWVCGLESVPCPTHPDPG